MLFRNSHWAFPLGLADTIAAPDGTVISFTDSIPWVSIFFKALRGVLPSTFQWFGWYTLFCFAMQGAAGALLCARGQAKTGAGALVFSTLGGLLFVMLPTLWERAFRHTALASQWLFLLALYAFLEYRQNLHRRHGLNVPLGQCRCWPFWRGHPPVLSAAGHDVRPAGRRGTGPPEKKPGAARRCSLRQVWQRLWWAAFCAGPSAPAPGHLAPAMAIIP